MKDFNTLSADEQKVIAQVQEVLAGIDSIPCTGCKYCVDGCPMQIHIPDIFSARNRQLTLGQIEKGKEAYAKATETGGKASACIGCGQCENACPQHINIIERLAQCGEVFDQ